MSCLFFTTGKDEHVTAEEIKSKQKIEVFKLDQIYNDWCQVRELNTPRTDRTTNQGAAPNPPATAKGGNQPPPVAPPAAPAGTTEADIFPTQQGDKSPERKGESKKEEKGSPEEKRKRERDKEGEDSVGNKSGHVKG